MERLQGSLICLLVQTRDGCLRTCAFLSKRTSYDPIASLLTLSWSPRRALSSSPCLFLRPCFPACSIPRMQTLASQGQLSSSDDELMEVTVLEASRGTLCETSAIFVKESQWNTLSSTPVAAASPAALSTLITVGLPAEVSDPRRSELLSAASSHDPCLCAVPAYTNEQHRVAFIGLQRKAWAETGGQWQLINPDPRTSKDPNLLAQLAKEGWIDAPTAVAGELASEAWYAAASQYKLDGDHFCNLLMPPRTTPSRRRPPSTKQPTATLSTPSSRKRARTGTASWAPDCRQGRLCPPVAGLPRGARKPSLK